MSPQEYKRLIKDFLDRRMSTEEFVHKYQKTFLSEPNIIESRLFWILERVFESAESYDPNCKIEEETRYVISEQRFREEVSEQLVNLEKYLTEHPGSQI